MSDTYSVHWMTDDRHTYWSAYIRQLADLLRLRDWDFILSRGQAADDALASVHITYQVRSAVVSLSPQWMGLSREKQREGIAHEVIHAHLDVIDTHVWHVEKIEGGKSLGILREVVKHDIECATDTLSVMVAPFLPLPESEVVKP